MITQAPDIDLSIQPELVKLTERLRKSNAYNMQLAVSIKDKLQRISYYEEISEKESPGSPTQPKPESAMTYLENEVSECEFLNSTMRNINDRLAQIIG